MKFKFNLFLIAICSVFMTTASFSQTGCDAQFSYSVSSICDSIFFSIDSVDSQANYSWTFGDGNTGTGYYTQNMYSSDGVYTVTVIMEDASGCVDTASTTVSINCSGNNCVMHPYFTADTDSVDCAVFFTSSNYGGTTPYTYNWNFGDGATSVAEHPYHSYNSSGTYTVCLTITDSLGCDSTYCDDVTVNCSGNNNCTMHPHFTTDADSVDCGIFFTSSNSGGTTPYSYYWDFNDGATSNLQHPYHNFNASGTYNVCLTITDTTGCDSTYCDDVTVTCGTASLPENIQNSTDLKVNVYPNPGSGAYIVELSEKANIVVYNVSGRKIFDQRDCKGKTPLDITSEAKGVYFLQVVSDQQSKTVKIIKR